MARSIASRALRRGLTEGETARLNDALEIAMAPRVVALEDDHHPAFLHPGRTVLILLNDVPEVEPETLTLAALLESRDPELACDPVRVAGALGREIATRVRRIPEPGTSELAERLVTLDHQSAVAVLSERLDHLRHEHLRSPRIPWADLVDEVDRVWLPATARFTPTLARRYGHWLKTFRHRV